MAAAVQRLYQRLLRRARQPVKMESAWRFLRGRRGGGLSLLAPGLLRGLGVSRAQAGGAAASALSGQSGLWSAYGADIPRFVLPNNGLLIEGQRTNLFTNPRCEGAVAGIPGTAPTNWVATSSGALVTREIHGVVLDNGLEMLDVSYTLTAGAADVLIRHVDQTAVISQPVTGTFFARLVSGTPPPSQVLWQDGGTAVVGPTFTIDGTLRPYTLSTTSSAGATFARWTMRFQPGGAAFTWRMLVSVQQFEVAAFASTPILPPVGTPGASTRGSDIVTAPLASLGVSSQGTFLGTFMLPQAAPASANQFLIQIENGNDVYRVFNITGAPSIRGGRVTSGVTSTVTLADMTPGTAFRVGFTFDSAGRMALSMEGAAPTIVTGGPAGMVTLRVGNNTGNAAPMFGECRFFQAIPRALSDAELAAAVAALPL